jgi:hypothetical protein
MGGCRLFVGLALGTLALTTAVSAATAPVYTLAATQACLTRLPETIVGLPPTTPPIPPALFVYPLAHDAASTWGPGQPPPRAHKQLGTWYGDGGYQGIILSFFRSVDDARVSLKSLVWLYGGTRVRNVVLSWDQKSIPILSIRNTVLACLQSGAGRPAPTRPVPSATLATFAGWWGGHTRGLSITSRGQGTERASGGCCMPIYKLTFQILSVSGTLTRSTAAYRVTSFRRYESGVKELRSGQVGKLLLRNGIVTNTLTDDYFCSNPAWGATNACGL